jgi:hypothetical protein
VADPAAQPAETAERRESAQVGMGRLRGESRFTNLDLDHQVLVVVRPLIERP